MTLNPGAAAGAPLASLPTPPASVAVSNNSFGRSSSEEILQELLLTATEAGGVGRLAGGAAEAAVWLGVILALRSFLVFEDCLFEERPENRKNNVKKIVAKGQKRP